MLAPGLAQPEDTGETQTVECASCPSQTVGAQWVSLPQPARQQRARSQEPWLLISALPQTPAALILAQCGCQSKPAPAPLGPHSASLPPAAPLHPPGGPQPCWLHLTLRSSGAATRSSGLQSDAVPMSGLCPPACIRADPLPLASDPRHCSTSLSGWRRAPSCPEDTEAAPSLLTPVPSSSAIPPVTRDGLSVPLHSCPTQGHGSNQPPFLSCITRFFLKWYVSHLYDRTRRDKAFLGPRPPPLYVCCLPTLPSHCFFTPSCQTPTPAQTWLSWRSPEVST